MTKWKEYKLADIAEIKYGKAHQSLADGNIPTYGSGGLMRYVEKALYDDESILIPRKGTLNNIIYKNEPFWTVDTMFWTKLDKKKAFPKFLFYQLTTIDFANMNVGSAVPSMTVSVLNDLDILLPPLPEQKAIASVLSSLDDKIDLLHRQNKTLEQMAETLFRQWFIEGIKEDWEETCLLDAIILIGGGTPKTEIADFWNGSIKWLSGGDIASNHKSFISTSEKFITESGLNNSSAKLLPKFSTIITARGTVGKYCLLSESMTFSQSNYGIVPKFNNCYFFTYLLIAHSVDELLSAAYGSVFDTITTATFKEIKINLPKIDEINKFESAIKPYFNKMLNNQTQIRNLSQLRDTLLPKLMSGEVRVEV
jgi:type I restriction enzyme S subunit